MMKMEVAFQKRLEDQVIALKEEYPKIIGNLVTGNTFLEIIRVVRYGDVAIIVIGTHGRTGLAPVLIGSVADMQNRLHGGSERIIQFHYQHQEPNGFVSA